MERGARRILFATVLLLCLACVFATLYSGLGAPFQFDDELDIAQRQELEEGFIQAAISSPYRAITYLTYAIDWKTGGGRPGPFHRTNLALHLMTLALSFTFIYLFLREVELKRRLFGSALGTLFLGVHPLVVSNVTYVSGRAGLLACIFSLGVILLYYERPFRLCWAPASALFIFALFSKEDAASLPLLLLAMGPKSGREGEFENRGGRYLTAAPFFVIAGIYGFFRIFLHRIVLGEAGGSSWAGHLAMGPYVWIRSIAMIFWPAGLSVDHHPGAVSGFFDPHFWLPFLCLLVLAVAAVHLWRKGSKAILWPIWFAAAMLPSTVMPLADPLAQNRLYFALAGVGIGTGITLAEWSDRRIKGKVKNAAVWICAAICLLLFSFQTAGRQKVWKSHAALWKDAARKAPDSTRPWDNLAIALLDQNDLRGAEFAVERSLDLDKNNPVGWNTLGLIMKDRGRYQDAIDAYDKAIWIDPQIKKVRANRANALLALGRIAEAENGYMEALAVDQADADAHYGIAYIYYMSGRRELAKEHLKITLSINPGDKMAEDLLAKISREMKDMEH